MDAPPERSLGDLVRDIAGNIDRIVRGELRVAIAELRQLAEQFSGVSILLGTGVVAATLSAMFLLLGAMFALGRVMPLWLAAVVVAMVPGALAAVLLFRFRVEIARRLAPASTELLSGPRGLT